MKPGLIIGGIIIVACTAIAGVAISGSSRQAISFVEARQTGEPCEVYGEVDKSSVAYDMKTLRFTLREFKRGKSEKDKIFTGEIMPVVYEKAKPQSFDQASDVKAIGAFRDGHFAADNLLVKCPSKYNSTATSPDAIKTYPKAGKTQTD
jgi:cytochrome c-type biogenesis protein CcmE